MSEGELEAEDLEPEALEPPPPSCRICGKPGKFPDNKCDECHEEGKRARMMLSLTPEAAARAAASEEDFDFEDDDFEKEEDWEGGECTRCGLYLDEGYCPNDRCPFSHCYQDEITVTWKYPGRAEKAYIKKLQGRPKD
jgi:hypothetical protein